eukprot:GGOE01042214.1.p1 GENE.GGOE01042214.1~~GGOE01042214.1.p1  ORF type:complete len:225 (-),score=28.02 GGOE01042214.1:217-867(-)
MSQGSNASKVEMLGPGLQQGALKVGSPAQINFRIFEGAGQGPLNVSVKAELAPKPLQVKDTGIGGMVVVFTPQAVGKHIFEFKWGKDHIAGSPLEVDVGGTVLRDPKKVRVQGDALDGGHVGERMMFLVIAPDNAGPGPLEVDASGPSEPEIELRSVDAGRFSITLSVSKPGEYKLAVYWGNDGCHVAGSPFSIKVVGDAKKGGPTALDSWNPTAS